CKVRPVDAFEDGRSVRRRAEHLGHAVKRRRIAVVSSTRTAYASGHRYVTNTAPEENESGPHRPKPLRVADPRSDLDVAANGTRNDLVGPYRADQYSVSLPRAFALGYYGLALRAALVATGLF